jgi:hypothetical protein
VSIKSQQQTQLKGVGMALRKSKLKISIKELTFEFEGSQEEAQVVQHGLQQTLGSLMNTQARVLTHRPEAPLVFDPVSVDATANGGERPGEVDGNGEKPKQPRQRRGKGGPSIANLLLGLKQEGYFSQPRSSGEVLSYLKDSKGHNLRGPAVLSELQRMIQKKDGEPSKLHRIKNESDNYIYKDSPFNESLGRPISPEQPAD